MPSRAATVGPTRGRGLHNGCGAAAGSRLNRTNGAPKTPPEVAFFLGGISNKLFRQAIARVARLLFPVSVKWIPSLVVVTFRAAILSGIFAVFSQLQTQQESRTLKFVSPDCTSCLIRSALSCKNPFSRFSA